MKVALPFRKMVIVVAVMAVLLNDRPYVEDTLAPPCEQRVHTHQDGPKPPVRQEGRQLVLVKTSAAALDLPGIEEMFRQLKTALRGGVYLL